MDPEFKQLVTTIQALAQLPLNRGRTLPREAYLSEALHRHEIDNLFQRQWICIGRSAQIPDPGDYLTFELVGHPLVAVRQKDGQILTFANICLHRCARLLSQSQGHAGRISCPYHSWTYDIDGRLVGAPFMKDTPDFQTGDFRLRKVTCEIWEGFIYVNLAQDPAPLADQLEGLQAMLGPFRLENYVPIIETDEVWDANWKCLAENFMDSYHIHRVHKDTFGPYGASEEYTTILDGEPAFSYQYVDADPSTRTSAAHEVERPMAHPDNTWLQSPWRERTVVAAVFPAHTMQVEADMLWHMTMQPLGTHRLKVRWWAAVPAEILASLPNKPEYLAGLTQFLEQVNAEDKTIVENVFHSMQSSLAQPGPLSYLEKNVVEFGRYISRSLDAVGGNDV